MDTVSSDTSARAFMAVSLATLTGILVTIPISFDPSNAPNGWVLLVGAAAGALVGWRRRASRGFLYFCAFAVLILASIITQQGYRPF